MLNKRFKVDCKFLQPIDTSKKGIGGQLHTITNYTCECEGTMNHSVVTTMFFKNCAECEHNKWVEEQ